MSITVILGITAIGTKLPPYIIFKGRQNAIIQKKLEKLDLVVNKKTFIEYNLNAWSTIDVMKDYHDKIWQPFVTEHLFSMGRWLLIMDYAPVHISEKLKIYIYQIIKDYYLYNQV